MRIIMLAAVLVSFIACSGPISRDIRADVGRAFNPESGVDSLIARGLREMAFNLENAVRIGALDAGDGALTCVQGVMRDLGIDETAPAPEAFTPQVETLLGKGSVLYIRARQARRLSTQGGLQIPADCNALIGQMVIDVGRDARAILVPGGWLIGR